MKTIKNYVFFWDGWLSNFYPCKIVFNNKVFCSSEQLFMYLKATFLRTMILLIKSSKLKLLKKLKS